MAIADSGNGKALATGKDLAPGQNDANPGLSDDTGQGHNTIPGETGNNHGKSHAPGQI